MNTNVSFKEKSKLLAAVAVIALVVCAFAVMAPAGDVDAADESPYDDITPSEFLALADDTGTITLDKSYNLTGSVGLTSDLTLVMNNNSLTTSGDLFILSTDGITLEIVGDENSSIIAGQSNQSSIVWGNYHVGSLIVAGGSYSADYAFVWCGTGEDGKVSISDATIDGVTTGPWISYDSNKSLTIDNCEITAGGIGIYCATVQNAQIIDTTVTVEGDDAGSALEIKAGTVDIENSKFYTTGYYLDTAIGQSQSGGSISAITINNGYTGSAGVDGVTVTIDENTVAEVIGNSSALPVVITNNNSNDISVTWSNHDSTSFSLLYGEKAGEITIGDSEVQRIDSIDSIEEAFQNSNIVSFSGTISAEETVTIPANKNLVINDGSTIQGTISIPYETSTATINTTNSSFTINNGAEGTSSVVFTNMTGTVTITYGSVHINGNFTGDLTVTGEVYIGGTITSGEASITADEETTVIADGNITVSAGASLTIEENVTLDINTYTLTNNGVITGSVTGTGSIVNNGIMVDSQGVANVETYEGLVAAIDDETYDIISINGTIMVPEVIIVDRAVTIIGDNAVLEAIPSEPYYDGDFETGENENKYVISLQPSAADTTIVLQDVTVDSVGSAFGINVWGGDVTLTNVASNNSAGAGFVLGNNAAVEVTGISSDGNVWGGMNVDDGADVTFTDDSLADIGSVYSEDTTDVQITVPEGSATVQMTGKWGTDATTDFLGYYAGIDYILTQYNDEQNRFNKDNAKITVNDDTLLTEDFAIAAGTTVTVAEGKSVSVTSGVTLINNGSITGNITGEGSLVNNNTIIGAVSVGDYENSGVEVTTDAEGITTAHIANEDLFLLAASTYDIVVLEDDLAVTVPTSDRTFITADVELGEWDLTIDGRLRVADGASIYVPRGSTLSIDQVVFPTTGPLTYQWIITETADRNTEGEVVTPASKIVFGAAYEGTFLISGSETPVTTYTLDVTAGTTLNINGSDYTAVYTRDVNTQELVLYGVGLNPLRYTGQNYTLEAIIANGLRVEMFTPGYSSPNFSSTIDYDGDICNAGTYVGALQISGSSPADVGNGSAAIGVNVDIVILQADSDMTIGAITGEDAQDYTQYQTGVSVTPNNGIYDVAGTLIYGTYEGNQGYHLFLSLSDLELLTGEPATDTVFSDNITILDGVTADGIAIAYIYLEDEDALDEIMTITVDYDGTPEAGVADNYAETSYQLNFTNMTLQKSVTITLNSDIDEGIGANDSELIFTSGEYVTSIGAIKAAPAGSEYDFVAEADGALRYYSTESSGSYFLPFRVSGLLSGATVALNGAEYSPVEGNDYFDFLVAVSDTLSYIDLVIDQYDDGNTVTYRIDLSGLQLESAIEFANGTDATQYGVTNISDLATFEDITVSEDGKTITFNGTLKYVSGYDLYSEGASGWFVPWAFTSAVGTNLSNATGSWAYPNGVIDSKTYAAGDLDGYMLSKYVYAGTNVFTIDLDGESEQNDKYIPADYEIVFDVSCDVIAGYYADAAEAYTALHDTYGFSGVTETGANGVGDNTMFIIFNPLGNTDMDAVLDYAFADDILSQNLVFDNVTGRALWYFSWDNGDDGDGANPSYIGNSDVNTSAESFSSYLENFRNLAGGVYEMNIYVDSNDGDTLIATGSVGIDGIVTAGYSETSAGATNSILPFVPAVSGISGDNILWVVWYDGETTGSSASYTVGDATAVSMTSIDGDYSYAYINLPTVQYGEEYDITVTIDENEHIATVIPVNESRFAIFLDEDVDMYDREFSLDAGTIFYLPGSGNPEKAIDYWLLVDENGTPILMGDKEFRVSENGLVVIGSIPGVTGQNVYFEAHYTTGSTTGGSAATSYEVGVEFVDGNIVVSASNLNGDRNADAYFAYQVQVRDINDDVVFSTTLPSGLNGSGPVTDGQTFNLEDYGYVLQSGDIVDVTLVVLVGNYTIEYGTTSGLFE